MVHLHLCKIRQPLRLSRKIRQPPLKSSRSSPPSNVLWLGTNRKKWLLNSYSLIVFIPSCIFQNCIHPKISNMLLQCIYNWTYFDRCTTNFMICNWVKSVFFSNFSSFSFSFLIANWTYWKQYLLPSKRKLALDFSFDTFFMRN